MANTSSAKKALRVSARRKAVNIKNKESYREAKKAVISAIDKGKGSQAKKLLVEAYRKIDIAAKKGTLHKNTASRYKSRLATQVNKITK